MKELIKLSLSDIDVIREETEDDGNVDFALARLKFMGTSIDDTENSQGYLLDEKVLKEYASTALGKLITGKVNPYSKDMMSHEDAPNIFGYIPPNSEITFVQEDNRWFAICEAVISKIYCKDVIDAFRLDNDRCVSIEASVETSPNNPKLIESFMIHSITILSKVIRGAVKGATMEIIKFSSEKAEEYYNHKEENPLKKFSDERKKIMGDNKKQHTPNVEEESKMGLYKDKNKEEKMANKDVKTSEEVEAKLAENKEDDIIMGSDENTETAEMGCGEDAKMADTEPEKQLDTVNEDPQDNKNHNEEAKAQWSMEQVELLLADSTVKDEVVALFSGDSVESLVSNLVAFAEEKEQLKKDKEKNDKEKADVKFSQIMAMAKLKLDNEKYDEIYKRGKELKLSELDSFEKDVKAFICDTVVFSEKVEENANVSFGTHMTLTETENKGLWN